MSGSLPAAGAVAAGPGLPRGCASAGLKATGGAFDAAFGAIPAAALAAAAGVQVDQSMSGSAPAHKVHAQATM